MTVTFYADISEFQRTVDNTYPHPVLAARVDTGFRLDNHIAANWAHAHASPQIQVFIGYVVFIPGQRAQILHRVKSVFGPTPPPKLVLMIDMESGQGFAGRGNHSAEANGLAQDFATYLGSTARVVGYANHYDFQECWPTRPAWLKLITAAYGDQNPGTFAWQYYGGVPNPRPYGYPGSCPPFGTDVDLNAIQLPITGVLTELGLTSAEDDMTPDQANQLNNLYVALFKGGPDTPHGLPLVTVLGAVYDALFSGGSSMPEGKSLPALVEETKVAAVATQKKVGA